MEQKRRKRGRQGEQEGFMQRCFHGHQGGRMSRVLLNVIHCCCFLSEKRDLCEDFLVE